MNPLRRFAPWVSDTWRQVLTTLVPRWRPRDWRSSREAAPVETSAVVEDVPVAVPSTVVDFAPPPVGNDIGHESINGPEEARSARWHLRGALLDRLDEYFRTIRQVRRYDPDAYALFSQVGLTITADVFVNPDADDHKLFHWTRSAFGGVLFPVGTDVYTDVQLSFIYFEKLQHPTSVQRVTDADIYALTVFYDKRAPKSGHWQSEVAVPMRCHVAVFPDGQMQLLKEATLTTRDVQPGTKRGRRSRDRFQVKTVQWRYPGWFFDDDFKRDPNAWATGILRLAVGTCASALDKINVRVKRDTCTATFGIDIARAKTFFADRDTTALAVDGKRKRIFHFVKAHPRRLASGVIEVVAHYRGLQSFAWKSYDVHIVTPQLGGAMAVEVPMQYLEDIPVEIRDQYLDTAQVGHKIADHLDTPLHQPRRH